MKVVIDIDDETYETIKNAEPLKWDCPIESAYKAIKNGTPLPKGHGRLIDVSNLLTVTDYDGENEKTYVPYNEIDNAPTIIETDKAE